MSASSRHFLALSEEANFKNFSKTCSTPKYEVVSSDPKHLFDRIPTGIVVNDKVIANRIITLLNLESNWITYDIKEVVNE